MQITFPDFLSHRFVRLLLVAIAIGVCLWIIRAAATFGFSRFLVRAALVGRNLDTANRAVRLAPTDAEAHETTAAVLSLSNPAADSAMEMERAAALRPTDYSLWLQLGLFRDQMGDTDKALSAFDEAVRRAPFYALPRWYRGNLLLRVSRYEDAFQDLNQAAQSSPELVPKLLDLAWSISTGDPKLTEQLAQVKTAKMRIGFARFLVRQGKTKEAIEQFRAAGFVPEDIRRGLVDQLIAKGAFTEALEVWNDGQASAKEGEQLAPTFHDGGFEGSLTFDDRGFGWRMRRRLPGVAVTMDSSQPHSGSRNLRIDFGGDSNPELPIVAELIVIKPSAKYKINFAAQSQDVVTGGLPLIVVNDVSGDRKRLGQSAPLSKGTRSWQVMSFEFTTGATTNAVVVSLRRENCSASPCPMFGSISLDSFSVEELK